MEHPDAYLTDDEKRAILKLVFVGFIIIAGAMTLTALGHWYFGVLWVLAGYVVAMRSLDHGWFGR